MYISLNVTFELHEELYLELLRIQNLTRNISHLFEFINYTRDHSDHMTMFGVDFDLRV